MHSQIHQQSVASYARRSVQNISVIFAHQQASLFHLNLHNHQPLTHLCRTYAISLPPDHSGSCDTVLSADHSPEQWHPPTNIQHIQHILHSSTPSFPHSHTSVFLSWDCARWVSVSCSSSCRSRIRCCRSLFSRSSSSSAVDTQIEIEIDES